VTDLIADPNAHLVAWFSHDQADMQLEDPVRGAVMRPGILCMMRHVSGQSLIACSDGKAMASQQESRLIAATSGAISWNAGKFIFAQQQAIELGANERLR
jgi:hypothetical protein